MIYKVKAMIYKVKSMIYKVKSMVYQVTFLNDVPIPEVSFVKVLGFIFDSSLTLPGRSIMYYVVGSDVWTSYITVNLYFSVGALLPFTDPGFVLHWNTYLSYTLGQH